MDKKLNQQELAVALAFKILGILILLATLEGCVGGKSKDEGIPAQNIISDNDNLSVAKNSSTNSTNVSVSNENQIRLLIRPSELNRSGRLPVTLRITNPTMNGTVLTVFKPQSGQEWYDQIKVNYSNNNNWTRNYTIRRVGNISYVLMFVQVSYNNTVIKRGSWNITLEAPVEKAK